MASTKMFNTPSALSDKICRGEKLAQGQFSVVHKGTLGARQVVVKEINTNFYDITKIEKEVALLVKLDSHPNIIRYFGCKFENNMVVLILEFCSSNLKDWVDTHKGQQSCRADILFQATSGVAHLHSHEIIHMDLKPENILVNNEKNGKFTVKVSDFGISRNLVEMNTIRTSTGLGTEGWMSQEILKRIDGDGEKITQATDVFSLGCVFYFVVTDGNHPFGTRYERNMNILRGTPKIDPEHVKCPIEGIINLVADMITHDPKSRTSASKLMVQIKPLRSQDTVADEANPNTEDATTSINNTNTQNQPSNRSSTLSFESDGTFPPIQIPLELPTTFNINSEETSLEHKRKTNELEVKVQKKLRTELVTAEDLFEAIDSNNLESVRSLCTAFDENQPTGQNLTEIYSSDGRTPLHAAIIRDTEIVTFLLEMGFIEVLHETRMWSIAHHCVTNTAYCSNEDVQTRIANLRLIQQHNNQLFRRKVTDLGLPQFCPRVHVDLLIEMGLLGANLVQPRKRSGKTILHSTPSYLTPPEYHKLLEFFDSQGWLQEVTVLGDVVESFLSVALKKLELERDTIKLLSKFGTFTETDRRGRSFLADAIEYGRSARVVEDILQNGGDPRQTDSCKDTILHDAAFYGNASVVRYLVDKFPNLINQSNNWDRTPLHQALRPRKKVQVEIITLLIAAGAKWTFDLLRELKPVSRGKVLKTILLNTFNTKGAESTFDVLSSATESFQIRHEDFQEILVWLLEQNRGDGPTTIPPMIGHVLLYRALQKFEPMPETLQLFADQGVDFKCQALDPENCPLFMWAVRNKRSTACLEKLIQLGADHTLPSKNGVLPLHVAAKQCLPGTVQMLLEKWADVNAVDSRGQTPLHFALKNKVNPSSREETVKLLISHGANINAEDDAGQTPFAEAIGSKNCSTSMLQWLVSRGFAISPST